MSSELVEAVLDASVLIQTVIKEKDTEIALKLVSMLKTIYAPPLILYEAGNALVILTRKNFITKEDALRKFKSLSSIPTLHIREIAHGRAMDIATELKTTHYDAAYLTLALEAEVPLITADNELYRKGRRATRVIQASDLTL